MTRFGLSPASGVLLSALITVFLAVFIGAVFFRQHPVAAVLVGGTMLAVGIGLVAIERHARRLTG